MTPTEIVKVNRFTGSQWVYNLSTSDHWFTGNGIASHNCRCTMLLEVAGEPTDMGNRGYKDGLAAAGYPRSMTLMQFVCTEGQFCQQTHKPGLCKGQKRGQTEPGAQDATKQTPAEKAQIAVKGLSEAIARATQVAQANAVRNPKLAGMARRAVVDYAKALRGHQQTLKDAARSNDRAKRIGIQDTRQQDTLDRREQRKRETLGRRAQAILDRRREAAKVAKMSPKQRAAYGKRKSAEAKAKHQAAENKVLKEAGKA